MLVNALSDLLFPRACVGCGGPAQEIARYFCWDCLASLALIQAPFCRLCGAPVDGALDDDFICGACCADVPAFDLARAAARYQGILQVALQEFKYRGATWLSHDLSMLLLGAFQAHYASRSFDVISYVPLYAAKERERSYNQTWLLAGELSRRLPHIPQQNLLIKQRPTPTQTHLTARQRRANVRGAFAIAAKGAVADKRILLIDDVITTGATVNECALALKKSGARSVCVLSVARG